MRTAFSIRPVALAITLALGLGPLPTANAAGNDEAALRAEVAELRAQLIELKHEVQQMHAAPAAAAAAAATATTASTAPASAATLPANADAASLPGAAPMQSSILNTAASATTLYGYGEMNYTRPTKDKSATQADLARAVFGFIHAFDENTRIVSEFEWEHAVASASDQGEAEVEQLYIEHQLQPNYGLRAGLMLIPLGLLNEHHEPTNYYGVYRNFVETAIIPSTWREGGVSIYGNTEFGLNWSAGVTTGPDLSKWDPTSPEGRESPLGSIHQELQLAKARDPSVFAAANWQGIPGLTVGGGIFTGKIGQGQPGFLANHARLLLGEGHVRWQTGPFDLSALYTRGTISDTENLNLTFIGNPTPVPKSFWGGYVQGAWRAWEHDGAAIAPFVRYEEYNTAASYEAIPLGLGVDPLVTSKLWTAGVNYWLNPNVVFKADYQQFRSESDRNRFDLGIGFQF